MDSDSNAGLSLEGLRASAPRSFDKTIIDLLVAIQHGLQPIAAPPPAAVVLAPRVQPYDDGPLRAQVAVLEARVRQAGQALTPVAGDDLAALTLRLDQVISMQRQHEADIQQLMHDLGTHTHEPIKQVA